MSLWGTPWNAKRINLLKEVGAPQRPGGPKAGLFEASPCAKGCGTLFGYAPSPALALLTPCRPSSWSRPWQVEAVVRGLSDRA